MKVSVSVLAFAVVVLATGSRVQAQSATTVSSGTSYAGSTSATWGSGPSGSYSNIANSGSQANWNRVEVTTQSPYASFQGSFASGNRKTWNQSAGTFNGQFGAGSYGANATSSSAWDKGKWAASSPAGGFGGEFKNLNTNASNTSWSRNYP